MLKILHKGIHINLDLDTTSWTGDVDHDSNLTYMTDMNAGKLVALDTNGKLQLADGDPTHNLQPIGFNVLDAAGYFMQNKPAVAAKMLGVTGSPCVVITDQIDTALSFLPGQKLYCGTTGKLGLVTNVPASGAKCIGIAGSAASVAAPELKIIVQ